MKHFWQKFDGWWLVWVIFWKFHLCWSKMIKVWHRYGSLDNILKSLFQELVHCILINLPSIWKYHLQMECHVDLYWKIDDILKLIKIIVEQFDLNMILYFVSQGLLITKNYGIPNHDVIFSRCSTNSHWRVFLKPSEISH